MLSKVATAGFWTPTNETVTAIAAALGAHWTAAKAAAKDQFWGRTTPNWLNVPRHYLNRVTTHRS
jgi:hypothetical protein